MTASSGQRFFRIISSRKQKKFDKIRKQFCNFYFDSVLNHLLLNCYKINVPNRIACAIAQALGKVKHMMIMQQLNKKFHLSSSFQSVVQLGFASRYMQRFIREPESNNGLKATGEMRLFG